MGIVAEVTLGNNAFFIMMQVFNRILNGYDVAAFQFRSDGQSSAAIVVDLPLPAGPVTRIKPRV